MSQWCWRYSSALVALALAGCASSSLPDPGPNDCQIRAGAALTEGTASYAAFGSVAADARGGSVTVYGDCAQHQGLHVLTRTPSSVVCYGPSDWCAEAVSDQPVTLTREQLRALVSPG